MNRASTSAVRPPSISLIYFVAAALGVAFSAVLLVLAWNTAIHDTARQFAYESLSLDEVARKRVRAVDESLHGMTGFIRAVGAGLDADAYRAYCEETFSALEAIKAVIWYVPRGGETSALDVREFWTRDPSSAFTPRPLELNGDAAYTNDLRNALESDANIPVSLDDTVLGPYDYALARRATVARSDARGVLVFIIDARQVFGQQTFDPALAFDFYLESEGMGGRRTLLHRDKGESNSNGVVVKTLNEENQVRFDRYSMRFSTQRDLYWRDIDKALFFTALLLSAGITLLLIALARAKELQMRELAARNRLIEEQVRQQTHELAVARDAALSASRVKSDFLASMSHEIRTPLNAIIGMAELLGDTALSAEQARYVGVFKNAGEALLSLVNDILDLSKIEADQLVLEEIEFEPREILEQAAEICALKATGKGLELAVQVAPDVPDALVGDPSRLRQVVLNLIGNAIKFTERGEIVISAQRVTTTPDGVRLQIAVRDTGIGIPADKLESIFGSFTQVDSSTTRKYGGTGLGLAISKRLVELMGGRIWVESEEGRGSVFHFEVRLGAARLGLRASSGAPRLAGKSVLVIDDNATNRLILAQTLGAAGARVAEMHSGADALRWFRARRAPADGFDVILCDSQMPELDGFTTIEALLTLGVPAGRVVMLTSSNLGADVERSRGLGLGGYLVKPIKRKELYAALGRVLTATPGASPATSAAPGSESAVQRHAVLLVEDNPDNRMLIKAYLKREPFDVDEAENGEEAVQRLREKSYDLVLMDVQMPVMDGHAATRAIRQQETEQGVRRTPVIALTAHAVREEVEKSLQAGCDAHLTKPIKKQALLEALSAHLAR